MVKDRKKCFIYLAAFIIFQTIIIVAFSLTVMKIKNPKLRLGGVAVENFSSTSTNSSFSMTLATQVTIKNTNFGHYKYDNSTLNILYGDVRVGEAFIPKGRAKARKTKRFNVTVDISSEALSGNSNFNSDVNSGVLTLTSQARVTGKVTLMKIMKKRKSPQMNCSMGINLATRVFQDLSCK